MARPRSQSDEALLDAALAILQAAGPDGVTFAAVSRRDRACPGDAGAALRLQAGPRQGGAAARLGPASTRETEALAAATDETPAGAIALLVGLSADFPEGDAYADQLMILREDFRDADLRARGRIWGRRLREITAPRLAPAGMPDHDAARELTTLWQGAILWWGFERDGPAEAYVAALLGSWLRRRERREA